MEYKLESAALQDIQTKTVVLEATAGELGTISAGNLLIPLAGLVPDFTAANVFRATNITADEPCAASIVGTNLVLDSSTAIVAANQIQVILRLP